MVVRKGEAVVVVLAVAALIAARLFDLHGTGTLMIALAAIIVGGAIAIFYSGLGDIGLAGAIAWIFAVTAIPYGSMILTVWAEIDDWIGFIGTLAAVLICCLFIAHSDHGLRSKRVAFAWSLPGLGLLIHSSLPASE